MTQVLLVMVLAAPASREVVFARLQQEPERDAIEKTTALGADALPALRLASAEPRLRKRALQVAARLVLGRQLGAVTWLENRLVITVPCGTLANAFGPDLDSGRHGGGLVGGSCQASVTVIEGGGAATVERWRQELLARRMRQQALAAELGKLRRACKQYKDQYACPPGVAAAEASAKAELARLASAEAVTFSLADGTGLVNSTCAGAPSGAPWSSNGCPWSAAEAVMKAVGTPIE